MTREVSASRRVVAEKNFISEPEHVFPYDIAAWKFKPDQVPAGTVLFKDDFEHGLDRWDIQSGLRGTLDRYDDHRHGVRIVDEKGMDQSRALAVDLEGGSRMVLLPKVSIRQKNVEINSRFILSSALVYCSSIFEIPQSPRGSATAFFDVPSQTHGSFKVGWVHHRVEVRGTNVYEQWFQGGKLKKELWGAVRLDYGPFLRVGIAVYPAENKRSTLYIDHVEIKKLAD